jgi:hypothetical protein
MRLVGHRLLIATDAPTLWQQPIPAAAADHVRKMADEQRQRWLLTDEQAAGAAAESRGGAPFSTRWAPGGGRGAVKRRRDDYCVTLYM